MNEFKQEVLQAEAAIQQLAEELARAKGIADSTEEVRRQLRDAATLLEQNGKALEQSRKALEEAQVPLKDVIRTLNQTSEQLSQSTQDLSSKLTQAIIDSGERVQNTLQQAYQGMQAQLTEAIGKAQKALSDAADSLAELRTNFESRMSSLAQQNEKLLHLTTAQSAEIKRLSKLLIFCLALSVLATVGIGVLALLLIRAQ